MVLIKAVWCTEPTHRQLKDRGKKGDSDGGHQHILPNDLFHSLLFGSVTIELLSSSFCLVFGHAWSLRTGSQ